MNLQVEVARQNVNLPTLPDSGQLIARADGRNFDLQTRRTELEQQGFRVRLSEAFLLTSGVSIEALPLRCEKNWHLNYSYWRAFLI